VLDTGGMDLPVMPPVAPMLAKPVPDPREEAVALARRIGLIP
jgi:hypothetical protein